MDWIVRLKSDVEFKNSWHINEEKWIADNR